MQFFNLNTNFAMNIKISNIVPGNDGFGANANSPTEHPQWVLDAVEREQQEREEAEREAKAHGRWRQMNTMADGNFLAVHGGSG